MIKPNLSLFVVVNFSMEGDIFHGVFGSSELAEELVAELNDEGCRAYIKSVDVYSEYVDYLGQEITLMQKESSSSIGTG